MLTLLRLPLFFGLAPAIGSASTPPTGLSFLALTEIRRVKPSLPRDCCRALATHRE
jgi:hypothetical protein